MDSPASSPLGVRERLHQATRQLDQLATIRAKAASWGKGLAALLATIVGFGLITGPSQISELENGYAYLVGISLAGAVVAGLVATLMILRAAYGSAGGVKQNLAGDAWTDQKEAERSARSFTAGVVLICVSLALLMTAVGTTWYAPRNAGPQLLIRTDSGVTFCGESQNARAGELSLSTDNGLVTALLSDLSALKPVAKCPNP